MGQSEPLFTKSNINLFTDGLDLIADTLLSIYVLSVSLCKNS